MNQPSFQCLWTADLSPAAKDCIQGAIRLDNERYSVVPCHSGHMTALVRRFGEAGEQYLYELRCACDRVIRTDGGILPERAG